MVPAEGFQISVLRQAFSVTSNTMNDRKKIRGFQRKIRQLESWKGFIINYDFENLKRKTVFRVNFGNYYWTKDLNIHHKLEKHFLNILSETLIALKENQTIIEANLIPKLWFYFPRTYKTIVVVGQLSDYQKMESQIELNLQTNRKPRYLMNHFNNLKI